MERLATALNYGIYALRDNMLLGMKFNEIEEQQYENTVNSTSSILINYLTIMMPTIPSVQTNESGRSIV